ncbi:MAG: GGDEF domain-containing protein [Paracoccus sp. (in: a-proteobacteria)]|nr:GGDEF domain-containing protein [Paracoccus sp. (in: a-proteobacteria)]
MRANDLIGISVLSRLLPMHLVIDGAGFIVSTGPTLRKLIGPADHIEQVFQLPDAGQAPAATQIRDMARAGEMIHLSLTTQSGGRLRGEAEQIGCGRILLNLGFGPGLVRAIADYRLTDGDFAASDLAIEMLYLHEANRALIGALSRQYRSLDLAHAQARADALTDPLTGVLNRRGLTQDMARLRDLDRQVAALVLDLDHFKAINDSLGHLAGDAMLRHVAQILRQELREGDTVARTGGDEFVILLHDAPRSGALHRLARRIMARVSKPFEHDGTQCRAGVSIGGACGAGADAQDLMARADLALYAAKQGGRGQFRLAKSEIP